MSDWVTVAKLEQVPPGERRIIDIDDVQIAVFNLGGDFYAIEDVCTHDYAPLTDGKLDGDEIICPRHGARFCIKTGAVTAPPAYEPIPTFPVRIHEGLIQVRDARWD